MENILAVIPARSGSKGVQNKNIRFLGGHPLMAWSIKTALESNLINRVIVSTDSKEYSDIAKEYNAEVPVLRPKSISNDQSKDIDLFVHLLEFLKNEKYTPDLIVHLRPTTPLRDSSVVDDAIREFKKEFFTSLRSVHKLTTPINKSFVIDEEILKGSISLSAEIDKLNDPRQNFPNYFQANGYVDIITPETILNKRKLHGNKTKALITHKVYEVDTEDDFRYMEYLVSKLNIKLEE